jgi:hypothetical protein
VLTQLVVSLAITAPVVALIVLAARRPGGVRLEVANDEVHVVFTGAAPWLVMQRRLTIPASSVRGVAVVPSRLVPRTGLRLPGASFPGVIRAGSYGTGPQRDLWFVRGAEHLLVIELEPGEPYRRIVLEVPDAHAEALRLRPVLGAYTGAFG